MFNIHAYLDNKLVLNRQIPHIPNVGDTMRLSDTIYAKVTELIWCMDEDDKFGVRVNIRMIKETNNVQF